MNFKRYMVWDEIQEIQAKNTAFQHHLLNKYLVIDIWHDIVVMMQGTFERAFDFPDQLYAKCIVITISSIPSSVGALVVFVVNVLKSLRYKMTSPGVPGLNTVAFLMPPFCK